MEKHKDPAAYLDSREGRKEIDKKGAHIVVLVDILEPRASKGRR